LRNGLERAVRFVEPTIAALGRTLWSISPAQPTASGGARAP
jgi:hypothetical protein